MILIILIICLKDLDFLDDWFGWSWLSWWIFGWSWLSWSFVWMILIILIICLNDLAYLDPLFLWSWLSWWFVWSSYDDLNDMGDNIWTRTWRRFLAIYGFQGRSRRDSSPRSAADPLWEFSIQMSILLSFFLSIFFVLTLSMSIDHSYFDFQSIDCYISHSPRFSLPHSDPWSIWLRHDKHHRCFCVFHIFQ